MLDFQINNEINEAYKRVVAEGFIEDKWNDTKEWAGDTWNGAKEFGSNVRDVVAPENSETGEREFNWNGVKNLADDAADAVADTVTVKDEETGERKFSGWDKIKDDAIEFAKDMYTTKDPETGERKVDWGSVALDGGLMAASLLAAPFTGGTSVAANAGRMAATSAARAGVKGALKTGLKKTLLSLPKAHLANNVASRAGDAMIERGHDIAGNATKLAGNVVATRKLLPNTVAGKGLYSAVKGFVPSTAVLAADVAADKAIDAYASDGIKDTLNKGKDYVSFGASAPFWSQGAENLGQVIGRGMARMGDNGYSPDSVTEIDFSSDDENGVTDYSNVDFNSLPDDGIGDSEEIDFSNVDFNSLPD